MKVRISAREWTVTDHRGESSEGRGEACSAFRVSILADLIAERYPHAVFSATGIAGRILATSPREVVSLGIEVESDAGSETAPDGLLDDLLFLLE